MIFAGPPSMPVTVRRLHWTMVHLCFLCRFEGIPGIVPDDVIRVHIKMKE